MYYLNNLLYAARIVLPRPANRWRALPDDRFTSDSRSRERWPVSVLVPVSSEMGEGRVDYDIVVENVNGAPDGRVCCTAVVAATATIATTTATTVAGRRRTVLEFGGCWTVAGWTAESTDVIWRPTEPSCTRRLASREPFFVGPKPTDRRSGSSQNIDIIVRQLFLSSTPPRVYSRQRRDRISSPYNITVSYIILLLSLCTVRGVPHNCIKYFFFTQKLLRMKLSLICASLSLTMVLFL